jgi:hypothetical protein
LGLACRRGLDRLGDTVDAVDYITFCNLTNVDLALRRLRCSP